MAKIVLGPIAGAISGSVGNVKFSHNRGGPYMAVRTIPTKVTNTYTDEVRNIFSTCSRAWGALTAAQQAAWNTWAQANPVVDALGSKVHLFGNAAYSSLNCRLLLAGDSAIPVPPIVAPPPALTTLTCVAGVGAASALLTTAINPLAANHKLWMQLAVFDNPGQNYFKNRLKLVTISAAAQATGLDIVADWILRFGTLIEGQRFVLRGAVLDDETGLLSGPVLYEGTVVA